METQDNGFLLVIDGVRKEKERLTAAKLEERYARQREEELGKVIFEEKKFSRAVG